MSIWNKVLVGLIGAASLVFFYTASRTLKSHQYWRELARQFQVKLEAVEKENRELEEAEKLESGRMGNRKAQMELDKILVQRWRVWVNCQPQKADAATGKVAVDTDLPVPNGITDKMTLYVFEETGPDKGGQYIGEFRVTAVAEKQIQLEPTMRMTERELKRVAGSKGPWMLYEGMPVDRHWVFEGMSDEDKKALLPAEVVNEYIKDGKVADVNDPKECQVDGKYVRQLRDYREMFKIYHAERTLFVDLYQSMSRDHQFMLAAKTDADLQQQFAQKAVDSLRADLAVAKKELDNVVRHKALLDARLAGIQKLVKGLIQKNVAYAREIATLQMEAAKRIDERTRSVAQQGGAGAN